MIGEELLGAGIIALLIGMIGFVITIFAVLYVYTSLAFMAIAKKAKLNSSGLAWIPGIGPLIIAFQTAKMDGWPWLLLLSLLIAWIPFIGPVIYMIAMIAFSVYAIIWQWKMFEAVDKPGWWILLSLIPFVGWLVYLILLGIAAWSKN
jgi:uncharacterized membrane protein YhaH (DUF805 family)